jgi:hypothetical protein
MQKVWDALWVGRALTSGVILSSKDRKLMPWGMEEYPPNPWIEPIADKSGSG